MAKRGFFKGNPDFLRSRSSNDLRQFGIDKDDDNDDDEEGNDKTENRFLAGLIGHKHYGQRRMDQKERHRHGKVRQKKPLTVKFGSVKVTLKEGIYFEEQVDVIANSTSSSLELSSGGGSRAMLSKAGTAMQDECRQKYPNGVKPGSFVETKGYNLHCRYVFHVALTGWSQDNAAKAEQMLQDLVTDILRKCEEHKIRSLCLPPIGTGFMGYHAKTVARTFLQAVQDFGKTNKTSTLTDVNFVIRQEDSKHFEEFETEMRKFSYTNMQLPDMRKGFQDKKHIRKMVGNVTVDLIRGSLVDRKVDVLVNVTNDSLALDKGALSKAISEAAGTNLQLECKSVYPEGLELGEVGSTGAFEIEDVKTIYHTTLPAYSNGQGCPEEVLLFLVQRCLGKASEENYSSIGFPAVGTGYQGYPSKTAAQTMMSAIKEFFNASPSSTLCKVEIVIFEGGKDWREVWKNFQQELEKIPPSAQDLKKGHQGNVLTPLKAVARKPPPLPKRGTKEWFKMKYEQDVFIPVYWTSVKGGENVRKCQRSGSKDYELVDVDGATEQVIKNLVMKTWARDKVGDGRDAKNLRDLGFSSINVTRIQRVENVHLYKGYAEERQRFFDKASKKGGPFVSVGQTKKSSKEVETYSVLKSQGNATKFLSDTFSEINEHFLFHGTAGDNIEKVLSQGIDNRLAGDRAMFGAGVYAAESSTKADQYSDHRDSRGKTGLKMLLVRMSLGDICLCNQGQPFRRAPCKICQKDKCTCKGTQLWDFYDSVLGDGQWIFREFVVYEKRQVYPEYLISYDRV